MLQFKNHALPGSQPAERQQNLFAQLTRHQIALRIRQSTVIGDAIQKINFLPRRVDRNRGIFLAGLALPQMVQAEIGNNPVNPGVEGAFKAKVANVAIRFEKSFLVDVLGVGLGASQVQRETKHSLVVLSNQAFKRNPVAALGSANKIAIVDPA
jgi:hypothetical protein